MSASIHQEVDFKATPERVYQALTDAKQFSAFSGLPAEIHNEAGGAFKCFGGQITGRMTELLPGKKIVQTWHVAVWPETSPRGTANISTQDGHGCIGNL